ncbi:hypothetical protein [Proteus mirabilis]|uniref:hypothetical protein n=1 Tax=Proteus mirabilis TaxID=584 RepID=UPI0034D781BD
MPFDEAIGGDIVYQNVIANKNLASERISLSNTDFGEEFFWDTNDMKKVYVLIGDNSQLYAADFLEYLKKTFTFLCLNLFSELFVTCFDYNPYTKAGN